jgi:uncharacterized protein YjbI with pentapeptide repeats
MSTTETNNNTVSEMEANQPMTRNKFLRKSHSLFEWAQLIATISVPIAIAIYTVLHNGNETQIATENRQKDREIARESRVKDLEIALDQQRENTLADYISYLTKILIENETKLIMSVKDTHVAWFKTLTVMKRLDAERKSFLLKALYSAKLVYKKETWDPDGMGVLSFKEVDLSDITLGSARDSPINYPEEDFVELSYLSLAYANLTNASFRHTKLSDVNFMTAKMDSTDFTCAKIFYSVDSCLFNRIIFTRASLRKATFFAAEFYRADFASATLTSANLTSFKCSLCTFSDAHLDGAYIDQSYFTEHADCTTEYSNFLNAHMNESFLRAVHFIRVNFASAFLTQVHGINVFFNESIFPHALLTNSSFRDSIIVKSNFDDADLSYTDLSNSQMTNVSFIGAKLRGTNMSNVRCDFCVFQHANLSECVFKNAILINCDFRFSQVTDQQLSEAAMLNGSILHNETVI